MKHEYREGQDARRRFDEGMTKLFRIPKTTRKLAAKPKRKKAKASKD